MANHVDSILAMFFRASILDQQVGASWYNNAHSICVTLGKKYGFSTDQIAGAIAALSPNNKWDRNIQDAESLARAIATGIDPEEIKVCTFKGNKAKAIAILELNANYDQIKVILKGQKVTAFFENIATDGNCDAPVIDGHAYNVWNGTVSGLKDVPSMTPKAFAGIQDAYREAAAIATAVRLERGESAVSPSQMQAITWVAYRRINKGLAD